MRFSFRFSFLVFSMVFALTAPLRAAEPALPVPLADWSIADPARPLSDAVGGTLLPVGQVRAEPDEQFGHVFHLNGALRLPEAVTEQIRASGELTLSFWLYTTRTKNDLEEVPLFSVNTGGTDFVWKIERNGLSPETDTTGKIFQSRLFYQGQWTPHRWHHLVLSWDGASAVFHLNGNFVVRDPVGDIPFDPQGAMQLGSPGFEGKLARIRVYDRRLSDAQITQLMKATAPRDASGSSEPAPNCIGETLLDKKLETGYSIEELQTLFPPMEEWPMWEEIIRPADDFAEARFTPPPAPYVHPRLFFGPEQLPALREHFHRTHSGRMKLQVLRTMHLFFHPDPIYLECMRDKRKLEATPGMREKLIAMGVDPDQKIAGFEGEWMGDLMTELEQGRIPEALEKDWEYVISAGTINTFHRKFVFEAFRCVIEEDRENAERYGKALGTMIRRYLNDSRYTTNVRETSWQGVYKNVHCGNLGALYDFLYNDMSEEDRKLTRDFIAAITRNKTVLKSQHLPAMPGNTSNWVIIHLNLLPMILSIEGEEGYNHETYLRCLEVMKKWLYIANGPDGAPFEGYSKSRLGAEWLMFFGSRNQGLARTQRTKNVARKYWLHTMVPWGGLHTYETRIGPVDDGTEVFKYMYPEDPVIDLLYSYRYRPLFGPKGWMPWPNTRTNYGVAGDLAQFMAVQDPDDLVDGNLDLDAKFAKTMDYLKETGEPLYYYSDFRGILTARSAWDKDAVYFMMEPRNVAGGHTHASRNAFVLMGYGRAWATKYEQTEGDSLWHSIILIDGKGQGFNKTPQGRTLQVHNNETVSFIVGDAKWAYDFSMPNHASKGKPMEMTPNDSRLHPVDLPWMNEPWSNLPHWDTGAKPNFVDRSGHGHRVEHNPVEKSFRTGGLIRGKYPYALVIDDTKKDDQVRRYTWQMKIADDLKVEKDLTADHWDFLLVEDGPRRCRVRTLAAGGADLRNGDAAASGLRVIELRAKHRIFHQLPTLEVQADSDTGHFKTLIYPYVEGMPALQTAWNATRDRLTVTIGDQVDQFTFDTHPDGYTTVSMLRNGTPVFTTTR